MDAFEKRAVTEDSEYVFYIGKVSINPVRTRFQSLFWLTPIIAENLKFIFEIEVNIRYLARLTFLYLTKIQNDYGNLLRKCAKC